MASMASTMSPMMASRPSEYWVLPETLLSILPARSIAAARRLVPPRSRPILYWLGRSGGVCSDIKPDHTREGALQCRALAHARDSVYRCCFFACRELAGEELAGGRHSNGGGPNRAHHAGFA